jgi:hypothetical protein
LLGFKSRLGRLFGTHVPARRFIAERSVGSDDDLTAGTTAERLLSTPTIVEAMVDTRSTWLPDRAPTWVDVATAGLALFLFATNLLSLASVSWPWLVGGFVVLAVLAGPVANSIVGARVGEWFREIGLLGRVVAIVLFAFAVFAVRDAAELPTTTLTSFTNGIFLGVAVFVTAHVLASGGVGASGS